MIEMGISNFSKFQSGVPPLHTYNVER